MASGQIQVTVRLPKYQDATFSGFSRDEKMAKWAAAKAALIQLNKQSNVYIPVKAKEIIK